MEKHSRAIPLKILKSLLAKSGNQCAFKDCIHPLFDEENEFIAQLCHIEAVSPKGQRYNNCLTKSEINSFDNLLFLCYRHHKKTDNVNKYTVEKLKKIKQNHENQFIENQFSFNKEIIDNLIQEIDDYWLKIIETHKNHIAPEYAIPLANKKSILSLINNIEKSIEFLNSENEYLIQEIRGNHFETVFLSIPNSLTMISVTIDQLRIKYLEAKIQENPCDEKLKKTLDKYRSDFEKKIGSVGFVD